MSDVKQKIVCGDLEFYPESEVSWASWKGSRVPLSRRDFRLLTILQPGSGKTVSSKFLEEKMRESGFCTSLRFMVKYLRNAFRAVDPSFSQLTTQIHWGYGWKTF